MSNYLKYVRRVVYLYEEVAKFIVSRISHVLSHAVHILRFSSHNLLLRAA
jgi:hypothetical protein